jgi:hypothetical protein
MPRWRISPAARNAASAAKMFSDRRAFSAARDPQVDHVEVISAELA